MSNKKATKRALLTSILAICLCLVMLIGSTFAWFTDTASTSVNKIQSGTLKVDLEMKNANGDWQPAKGQVLKFFRATEDGKKEVTDDILWEPNCTYQLQPIRVVNKGNLDLKYKIEITGIDGDVGLNKVITWTINDTNLGDDHKLHANENNYAFSDELIIEGHMDADAGNEYQNLTINGIAITVYATQLNSEYDSNGPDYDINATYPLAEIAAISKEMTAVKDSDGKTTSYTYASATVTASVPAGAVTDGNTPMISIEPTEVSEEISTTIKTDGKEAVAYNITVKNANLDETNKATVSFFVGKGLKNVIVYHENEKMTTGVEYNEATGFVTITSASFSPFTVTFDAPAAMANGVAYDSLTEAIAAGGNIVVTKSAMVTEPLVIDKATTLNLNGNTITSTWTMPSNASGEGRYALLTKAAVTITNGTFTAGGARALGAYADLTLNDVMVSHTLTGGHACIAFCANNGKCTIAKSTIQGDYAFSNFADNAAITISDSKIEGASDGVYHNGSQYGLKLNVTNTTINGGKVGVYISGSDATVAKGRSDASFVNCNVSGATAIEEKHADIHLSGVTLNATGDPTNYVENNNGSTAEGYCFAVTSNSKDGKIDPTDGTITFDNCVFNSVVSGCEVFNSYANADGNKGATINGYDNSKILYPGKLTPNA